MNKISLFIIYFFLLVIIVIFSLQSLRINEIQEDINKNQEINNYIESQFDINLYPTTTVKTSTFRDVIISPNVSYAINEIIVEINNDTLSTLHVTEGDLIQEGVPLYTNTESTIYSTYFGKITDITINEENTLLTILDYSIMEVTLKILQEDAYKVTPTSEVIVYSQNSEYRGTITYISPEYNQFDGTLEVKIEFSNNNPLILNNSYCEVQLVYQNYYNTISIEKNFIDISGEYGLVYVQRNQRIEALWVAVGMEYGNMIEIITNDLNVGDTIVKLS